MNQVKFDSHKHHRRSIRLKGFDYSQSGSHYMTIVAYQRECLFGEIMNGEMKLSRHGKVVQKWWKEIPKHFPNVGTGAFIVMPNHVHGIIIIYDNRRGEVLSPRDDITKNLGGETPPLHAPALGQIVAYFKYQSTKEMNGLDGRGTITKFWQRNYYEHIIRNEREMDNIWRYIESNPSAWANDAENPARP